MIISVGDLGFSYPSGLNVLHDISFDLDKPELIGILGPNGVGKSTLIHCINRILDPSAGTVLVEEKKVSEYRLKDLAKILGYVPVSGTDAFPMTVMDTILVGRHPRSQWRTSEADFEAVYDVMDMMGIMDLAMRPFNELSAGQRQKVMLARGLVQNPRALLLDEPTANLDIRHQYEVTKILRDITRNLGMLVVMICHDLNIAAKYCDRIILMGEGTIYAEGTPREVIVAENIKHVYGVECRIVDDNGAPHVIVTDEFADAAKVVHSIGIDEPASDRSEEQTV